MNAIIIYWSKTGNTEKVARALKDGLEETGMEVLLQNVEGIQDVDWYGYDLVCIGFPSYQWKVPKPMDEFLNKKFNSYRSNGHVKEGAPRRCRAKTRLSFALVRPAQRHSRGRYRRCCMPGSFLSIWG